MRKHFSFLILLSAVFFVGCGGNSGVAELKTYPPVTAEEQQVIDENIAALKDDAR